MKLESTSAQITVSDSVSNAGGNIQNRMFGYACDISFYDGAVYLCRRQGDPFVHIVLVPGERWKQDLIDEGYEIIAKLPTLEKSVKEITIL